ncbi:MAG: LO7 [Arowana adomavirus]|uniref:LO7 n=1 Tax=Arowana adomavirus TaxID=2219223 RepID=A0A2U9Q1M3_9VIRU|nr:MAG: LO7 [Arowana adomavirus]
MTTAGKGSYDKELAEVLQENMETYHIAAPITMQCGTKEAQTHGGPSFTSQVNLHGTSEITLDVQCGADEAVLLGSLVFVARGSVVVHKTDGSELSDWQTTTSSTNTSFCKIPQEYGGDGSNGQGSWPIPPFVINSQFQQIDFEFGRTQSTNAFLSQARSSVGGAGALACMNYYWNEPYDPGNYHENSSGHTGVVHRLKMSVAKHDDTFEVIERMYHQLNIPFNALTSWDYDDHEVRRIYPRGMCFKVKLVTRPFLDRMILCDKAGSDTNMTVSLKFKEIKLYYTTLRIPHGPHRAVEPSRAVYPTMDFSVRHIDLVASQQSAVFPVTHTDSDFVPQFLFFFVAASRVFDVKNMRVTPSAIESTEGAIKRVRCTLNGNNNPDFMGHFIDWQLDLNDFMQRTGMYNAFLGCIGSLPARTRKNQRPGAEHNILSYATPDSKTLGRNSVILLTDPSCSVVREASSGLLSGRLDVSFEFTEAKVKDNMRLFCIGVSKQQIAILKTQEMEGMNPQYELDVENTKPAFTVTQTEEVTMQ